MARELFRAKVALYAKHFTDENLSMMTGLPQNQEQQQVWPQVLQVFRSDARSYRIDIETDSTIRADMTRNQEQMNKFLLAGTGGSLRKQWPALSKSPTLASQQSRSWLKFTRRSRASSSSASRQKTRLISSPPWPNKWPTHRKMKSPILKLKKLKMEMEAAQQKNALDMQTMQAKTQMEGQALQMKAQHDERMMALAEQLRWKLSSSKLKSS